MRYAVRQYRPAYFSGYEDQVCRNVENIVECPWFKNFSKGKGFIGFVIEDYGNGERIVSAKYANDESWVVAFACEEGSQASKDWRYNPQVDSEK